LIRRRRVFVPTIALACEGEAKPMKPPHVVVTVPWAGRALAWSALMAITVVLAVLLQALAASAVFAPEPDTPAACQPLAGVALADGDDVRARFLAQLCGEGLGTTSKP
jgi:hypothetical protein